MRERRRDDAKRLVEQMLARNDVTEERPEFLKIRINIALAEDDLDDAKIYLDQLGAVAAPTRRAQAAILKYRSVVEARSGESKRALEALDRAVELAPEDTSFRVDRARALLEVREIERARADLEFVLERRPRLAAARRLLNELQGSSRDRRSAATATTTNDGLDGR